MAPPLARLPAGLSTSSPLRPYQGLQIQMEPKIGNALTSGLEISVPSKNFTDQTRLPITTLFHRKMVADRSIRGPTRGAPRGKVIHRQTTCSHHLICQVEANVVTH